MSYRTIGVWGKTQKGIAYVFSCDYLFVCQLLLHDLGTEFPGDVHQSGLGFGTRFSTVDVRNGFLG